MILFSIITIIISGIFISMLNDEKRIVKEQEKRIIELEKILRENNITENSLNNNQIDYSIQKIKQEHRIMENFNKDKTIYRGTNTEEIKNNTILITGSIFIILAAIVFLTSTWNIVPNFIKTTILVGLVAVFLGASKIAANVFNLKQTSKAFYYIGMAYIPICLASISIFKLLGNYFSIAGEGKYIYLTISSIIVSFIYYTEYYKNKDKIAYVSSLIMQFVSVIFFMLIMHVKVINIYAAILLYNIIVLFISKDKYTTFFTKAILIGTSFLGLNYIYNYNFTWAGTLLIFEMIINLLVYYNREKKKEYIYIPFIISLIIIMGFSIIYNLKFAYHIYAIYAIAVYILANMNYLEQFNAKKIARIISIIFLILTYGILLIMFFSSFINNIIYFAALLLLFIHAYITEKNEDIKTVLKIMFTVALYTLIFSIVNWSKIEMLKPYIPTIVTLLLFGIQTAYDEFKDDTSSIIVQISESLAFIFLIFTESLLTAPITIMLAIYAIIVNKIIIEKNDFYDIVPFLGVLIKFVTTDALTISSGSILGIITIITLGVSLYKKNINVYTGISAFYLIANMFIIKNTYINCLSFISWNILSAVATKKTNQRDIFIFLTYTGGLYLYYTIIKNLNLKYNSIFYIALPIYAITTTRTVLKKYIGNINIIEMISLSFINILAISSYTSELDGMIFVLCIIGMIIYSYNKKISSIFIISIIAVIINAFILTIDFWKSIPWWVYMLTIGITLISFAIYNETNKEKSADAIKKIRDKLLLKD